MAKATKVIEENFSAVEKWICFNCIEENYLSNEVRTSGKSTICHYCGKNTMCISIDVIAERIELAFALHFRRTSSGPTSFQMAMLDDEESDYEWYREGLKTISAIQDAACIPEMAAIDIQMILSESHADFDMHACGEECEFDTDACYIEALPSENAWTNKWYDFENSLKYKGRFFNTHGETYLKEIFNAIDKLSTNNGVPLVIKAGPGTDLAEIYRARAFQSDDKLCEALKRPDLHLCNPPPRLAASGRMNAQGISVFYGATEALTAVAEVRPPVGSQVAVARFTIERTLQLLNLTALDSVIERGSIFDETYAHRLERAAFLKTLCKIMVRPVMPDDEMFEYLPTQAIADYLSTVNSPKIDGIVYPSVQLAGKGVNLVIFQNAATVAKLEIPMGVQIKARTGNIEEDGWVPDYSVTEWTVTNKNEKQVPENTLNCGYEFAPEFAETQSTVNNSNLQIDTENITVHVIQDIRVYSTEFKVNRSRHEQYQSPF